MNGSTTKQRLIFEIAKAIANSDNRDDPHGDGLARDIVDHLERACLLLTVGGPDFSRQLSNALEFSIATNRIMKDIERRLSKLLECRSSCDDQAASRRRSEAGLVAYDVTGPFWRCSLHGFGRRDIRVQVKF